MTYIITIANEKGGVAKTTTALCLGASLVEDGQRILLVDLDPQANLTIAMGIKPASLERSMADTLLGNHSILSLLQPSSLPGLDLAPANQELLMAEHFLTIRENYEHLLRKKLAEASEYDFILLDCPPTLGPLTKNALTAADILIIPTQCEYFSAYSLRSMLPMIHSIRQRTNPNLRYRLLLTMMDKRNRIHRSLQDQIRKVFGEAVFNTVIDIDTQIRESQIYNQPITRYASDSRATHQYRQLSEELREYALSTTARIAQESA
jgi:chromosome partitioning protein